MTATTIQPINLTLTNRKEPRVDSRLIAANLGITHRGVIKTLRAHREAFSEFALLRFQVARTDRNRLECWALLTEDQAYLLLTMSRNTPRVVALKVALVKAFRDSRQAVAVYREGTLPSTKELQDAIKAVPGGPGPYLYANVSKLINKSVGVVAGTRESCETMKQVTLSYAQSLAAKAIQGATDSKDAYARVRASLDQFTPLTA